MRKQLSNIKGSVVPAHELRYSRWAEEMKQPIPPEKQMHRKINKEIAERLEKRRQMLINGEV